MSCTIDDEGLKCTFPESYETATIFSHPVDTELRSVGSCVRLTEKNTCSFDKGFGALLKNVSHLLVTLPDTVKKNESFFCQVGYDTKVACQWNKKGSGNQTLPNSEGEEKKNDLTVRVLFGLSIVFIVIVILGFVSWIYCRRKISESRCWKLCTRNTSPDGVYHTVFFLRKAQQLNDVENKPTLRTPLPTSPPPETTTQPAAPPPIPNRPRLKELQLLKMMACTDMLTEKHIKNAERILFLEQAAMFKQSPPKLFLTAQPGAGKTMVLFLKGVEWLQKGKEVYIMSTWLMSRAVTFLLYSLMLRIVNLQQREQKSSARLHLLLCDLTKKEVGEKAVRFLSEEAERTKLYIIADEVGPPFAPYFHDFCNELLAKVSHLHFWAGSSFTSFAPSSFQLERLTRPILCPPEIVKEVEEQEEISEEKISEEKRRLTEPDPENYSAIKLLHRRKKGHSEKFLTDCSTCGQELAKILHSLRNCFRGNVANSTTLVPSSPLEWRDMLIVHSGKMKDTCGILEGLKDKGIPVQLMKNQEDNDDVATASSDVVWVADESWVFGLERAVMVCLGDVDQLHFLSRFCSHLVLVSDHN